MLPESVFLGVALQQALQTDPKREFLDLDMLSLVREPFEANESHHQFDSEWHRLLPGHRTPARYRSARPSRSSCRANSVLPAGTFTLSSLLGFSDTATYRGRVLISLGTGLRFRGSNLCFDTSRGSPFLLSSDSTAPRSQLPISRTRTSAYQRFQSPVTRAGARPHHMAPEVDCWCRTSKL